MTETPLRCGWCAASPHYIAYHDHVKGGIARGPALAARAALKIPT